MPPSKDLDGELPQPASNGILPNSPRGAAIVGLLDGNQCSSPVPFAKTAGTSNAAPISSSSNLNIVAEDGLVMQLELYDGTAYQGIAFGAGKSIAGELVFQTGMVGYPESITDPSYRGQILVITFPLVGNYGVPSRKTIDQNFGNLPSHVEAAQIHVSGLIVASYSGEDYSHHLATSSLGTWLKEQGVPAMHSIDTRALTKKIRDKGSMLGRMLIELDQDSNRLDNGNVHSDLIPSQPNFERLDWFDPNTKNLVADGERVFCADPVSGRILTLLASLCLRTLSVYASSRVCSSRLFGTTHQDCLCGCGPQIQSTALSPLKRRRGSRCPVELQFPRACRSI